jgi:hypothetical protein
MTVPSERLENALVRRLNAVNEWLRFAEAKNGAFLAIELAAMGVLVAVLVSDNVDLTGEQALVVGVLLVVLILSSVFLVLSFLPQTKLPNVLRMKKTIPKDDDNLDYFDHLKNYDSPALVAKLVAIYEEDNGVIDSKVALHLATQIIANSRICSSKLRMFTCSIDILFGGLVLGTLVLVITSL